MTTNHWLVLLIGFAVSFFVAPGRSGVVPSTGCASTAFTLFAIYRILLGLGAAAVGNPVYRGLTPAQSNLAGVASKVPPAHFCPNFASPAGIIEIVPGLFGELHQLARGRFSRAGHRDGAALAMKPISHCFLRQRAAALEYFFRAGTAAGRASRLLALATYQPSDPSLNTAGKPASAPQLDWPLRAYFSDVVLQSLGLTAFFVPLWLGGLGWTWMRSRPGGSAWLRWIGHHSGAGFFPAVLGLLPLALALARKAHRGRPRVCSWPVCWWRYLNIQGAGWWAGCSGRNGTLLCLGRQLLGYQGGHPEPLARLRLSP